MARPRADVSTYFKRGRDEKSKKDAFQACCDSTLVRLSERTDGGNPARFQKEAKMEKSIRTVFAPHEYEKVIEKSRFLTYCAHVESEESARAFLAEIRGKHTLATHVCYAFIADKIGNLQRFSDDGEPQGTAGVPILEVLKNKKLLS